MLQNLPNKACSSGKARGMEAGAATYAGTARSCPIRLVRKAHRS